MIRKKLSKERTAGDCKEVLSPIASFARGAFLSAIKLSDYFCLNHHPNAIVLKEMFGLNAAFISHIFKSLPETSYTFQQPKRT